LSISPRRGQDSVYSALVNLPGAPAMRNLVPLFLLAALCGEATAQPVGCDKACLEDFAERYRAAYLAHDPAAVRIARDVRFSENFVAMPFPDGTWDTVTEDL